MVRKSVLLAELLQWRKAVATVFAALRRDKDITQTELGRLVGWSRDKVSKFEKGKREIEFGDIVILCNALGEKFDSVIRLIVDWYNRHRSK